MKNIVSANLQIIGQLKELAIIRIGLENAFSNIEIDPHFGFAWSTIKYLNK